MNIGTLEALELLAAHHINTARTKAVDSAEDAIAFAERRNARDPREIAIVLRPADGVPAEQPALQHPPAIQKAYAALRAAHPDGVILAQNAVPAGTDIVISGETDDEGRRTIGLHGGGREVRRIVPLGEAGAEMLATHLQDHNHRGHSEKTRRMLEHLLLRVSDLSEAAALQTFRITVRLHENSYTAYDAAMTARAALPHARKPMARAHDRKAEGYRPAGRQ